MNWFMRKKAIGLFFTAFILSIGIVVKAQFHPNKNEKVNVIFDTDFGPDYDDVGAIAMLHAYADSGYVNILGTIASTRYEGVASTLDVFNTYFGRPGVPVGVPKSKAYYGKDRQNWSDTLIAKYPHKINSINEVPDAVELYRRLLAMQPDKSVTIITVGFYTNLDSLLKTGADEYSKLTGKELINKKVKLLVSMAGGFPNGKEFNIVKEAKAGYHVLKNWKTPILFTGWEIGEKVKTGLGIVQNPSIEHSPVKDVYRISIPQNSKDKDGRQSWDQTAVLIAAKGYKLFYDIVKGNIIINKDGSNSWKPNKRGKHAYLIEKTSVKQVAKYIEDVMSHQPKR